MKLQISNQLRLTIAGFIGLYLHGIVVATPGAFLPQWKVAFDNELNVGAFYTAFLLSSLVGLVLVSKKKKRHPFLVIAFAMIGIALAASSLSPTFFWISLAALPIGFGDGILNFHCNNLVGELHPKRRIVFLNWANATFGLGALSTPLLSTFLSWRWAFLLVAVLALSSILLAWNAPPILDYVPKQRQIDEIEAGLVVKRRSTFDWKQASPFWLVIFFYVGLESAIGTWSGTYLRSVGWSVSHSSALLSIYWVGLTLGRLSLGIWVNPKPVARLRVLLLAGLVAIALTFIPSMGFFFAVAAFFYGPTFATIFALLQERCGHGALSYLFYAAYIGKTLIPALLDQIDNPLHLTYGFLVLALLLYLMNYQLPRKKSQKTISYKP